MFFLFPSIIIVYVNFFLTECDVCVLFRHEGVLFILLFTVYELHCLQLVTFLYFIFPLFSSIHFFLVFFIHSMTVKILKVCIQMCANHDVKLSCCNSTQSLSTVSILYVLYVCVLALFLWWSEGLQCLGSQK